jgi:hypothetical protein
MASKQGHRRPTSFVRIVTRETGFSMQNIEHSNIGNRCHCSLAVCSVAIAMGMVGLSASTAANAQSTSATIFGQAPARESVTALSSNGLHRHDTVNKKGRYKIGSLPAGDYTVPLEKDGQTVDTRSNVALVAGRGAEVDFACPNDQCTSENR